MIELKFTIRHLKLNNHGEWYDFNSYGNVLSISGKDMQDIKKQLLEVDVFYNLKAKNRERFVVE